MICSKIIVIFCCIVVFYNPNGIVIGRFIALRPDHLRAFQICECNHNEENFGVHFLPRNKRACLLFLNGLGHLIFLSLS